MHDDGPARSASAPERPTSEQVESVGVARQARLASVRKGYRKGDETRERLISTTQESIYEIGFNRSTSREIARRAGVTFGVIQHHFGTFEALLLAAGERGMSGMVEAFAEVEIAGETTEEKLTQIANLLWRYFSGPGYISLLEIVTNLTRDPATSEETRARLHAGAVASEKLWLGLMRRTFGRARHGRVLRQLLFATMQGLAVNRWMNQGQPSFAKERRFLVAAVAGYLDDLDATE